MTAGSCLEAARDYLALGLHPIPCAPRSKRPLVEWRSFQQEQPHADQLDEWFTKWPDANVALVLGRGSFAVDLDGGHEAERLLIDQGVYLPGAPRVKTAGGYHVYLSAPRPVPDRVALLSTHGKKPQVDIRGVGIVVAPPSIHPSGVTYEWYIPLHVPFPPAPARLLELIGEPPSAHIPQAGGWLAEALAGVGEGQRDATCTRLAGYFLGHGLPAGVVEKILAATFASACTPPFPREDVRKCVQSIARRRGGSEPVEREVLAVSLGRVLSDLEGELTHPQDVPVPSPFGGLTRLLDGGFRPGELIFCGARAGVGKTAIATIMARTAATAGLGVLVISREMLNVAIARRLVAQASQVPASLLRSGRLATEPDSVAVVADTIRRMRTRPIWLCDDAVSIEEIQHLVATWSNHPALSFVIVDYLQLVRAPRDIRERRHQVEAVSQGLKTLALQARLPVLCLSSLARPAEGKTTRPTLASLRESGELEHDADIVLLLHRDPMEPRTECIVAKNRDGRVGITELLFDPLTVNFIEA